MVQGNLKEYIYTHTHSNTYTHSWREKGQYPEEEMVSHCYDWSHGKVQGGRSVTFIVKLIIPQKKIPLPCSHVLSPQQSCEETLSLHAEMSWARRSGKLSEICWTHTIFSVARLYAYSEGEKCIILQQEKKQLKIQKKRKHFKWAVQQSSPGILAI